MLDVVALRLERVPHYVSVLLLVLVHLGILVAEIRVPEQGRPEWLASVGVPNPVQHLRDAVAAHCVALGVGEQVFAAAVPQPLSQRFEN